MVSVVIVHPAVSQKTNKQKEKKQNTVTNKVVEAPDGEALSCRASGQSHCQKFRGPIKPVYKPD